MRDPLDAANRGLRGEREPDDFALCLLVVCIVGLAIFGIWVLLP